MRIVCAIDSFKGSLSSRKAALLAEKEARRILPGSAFVGFSVADGGEGTAEAVVTACGGGSSERLSSKIHWEEPQKLVMAFCQMERLLSRWRKHRG